MEPRHRTHLTGYEPSARNLLRKKDRFGNREGSRSARINAVITEKPKSIAEIQKDANYHKPIHSHLDTLISKGFIVKTPDGRFRESVIIQGKIRDLGQPYSDGTPRFEIHVAKKWAESLPFKIGERVPIRVKIAGVEYEAGLRATETNEYAWVCPDLIGTMQDQTTLGRVLTAAGFRANDAVQLRLDDVGTLVVDTPGNEAFLQPVGRRSGRFLVDWGPREGNGRGGEARRVMQALKAGPLTPRELADQTGATEKRVMNHIVYWRSRGAPIEEVDDGYILKDGVT